jgi:hypothetical protein
MTKNNTLTWFKTIKDIEQKAQKDSSVANKKKQEIKSTTQNSAVK